MALSEVHALPWFGGVWRASVVVAWRHPYRRWPLGAVAHLGGLQRPTTSHELAPPLRSLLYAIAEEDADDWATDSRGGLWAGLLRDEAEIVRRLREQIEAG